MPGTSASCTVTATPCPAAAAPSVPGATATPGLVAPGATSGVVMPTVPSTAVVAPTVPSTVVVAPTVPAPTVSLPATITASPTAGTTTPVVVPTPPGSVTEAAGGIGLGVLVGGGLGLLVVMALIAVVAGRGRHQPHPRPPRRDPVAVDTVSVTAGTEASYPTPSSATDVADLIHAYDLAGSQEERAVLERRLGSLGVVRLTVTPGDPVDPTRHQVVGVATHGTPGEAGTVSEVVRPGWADDDHVIRVCDVRAHATTGVHP